MNGAAYTTALGGVYEGDSRRLLAQLEDESIDLVFTSPPFPLVRSKAQLVSTGYTNVDERDYVAWLLDFGAAAFPKLSPTGSLVLDLGGVYERGSPTRSTYPFRVLTAFVDELGYTFCGDFYWHNPSKLPGPAAWVTTRRIRVKDSVDTIWWLAKQPYPKVRQEAVLVPYSAGMQKLLQGPKAYFKRGRRPGGHVLDPSTFVDRGGAIPANLLSYANSDSKSTYQEVCRTLKIPKHPARFPPQLPEFFIRFLTDPTDLVVDIFAGSNTTGMVAERLARPWLAFELDRQYIAASAFRFLPPDLSPDAYQAVYDRVMCGQQVTL